MKLKKLLSLKGWSHVLRSAWRYVSSPHVASRDKLLFLIPAVLYWVLPDFLPFMPIDDIGVSMMLMAWFVSRMDRKYPELGGAGKLRLDEGRR
ncbi:uncharacterized membrane protein YkvA (DUF1232 family) [Paenibacillus forsythiae]|uniref:Uncharacterized membrane protein YkvA (DUF1232 family) n=1 Tax=Paenibacillus forsythiae TaxID=365616 RepID=A0ABU3H801_9BACL|nr:hypothetical protein [Paenibacillus forsythiae]MDT3426958.1 uncharacterized membrane protein YkvA (DUF1232 family) [Paenibacillus forsythiae]